MLRFLFYAILIIIFVRALWRFWDGIKEGMNGGQSTGGATVPQRGVQMVRDPVCGTFLIRERAVTLATGRHVVYFCSTGCRDKYRAGAA
jgi:YHS domain-containing protein